MTTGSVVPAGTTSAETVPAGRGGAWWGRGGRLGAPAASRWAMIVTLPVAGRAVSPASIATVSVPAALTCRPVRVWPARADRSSVSPKVKSVMTFSPPAATSTGVSGMPWMRWMRAALCACAGVDAATPAVSSVSSTAAAARKRFMVSSWLVGRTASSSRHDGPTDARRRDFLRSCGRARAARRKGPRTSSVMPTPLPRCELTYSRVPLGEKAGAPGTVGSGEEGALGVGPHDAGHPRPRQAVHEHPAAPVDGRGAHAPQHGLVPRAGVALVLVEPPVRVVLGLGLHDAVAGDLGQDRGCRDRQAAGVAPHDALGDAATHEVPLAVDEHPV